MRNVNREKGKWMSLDQNQSNHSGELQRTQTVQWTNQISKQIHVADCTRGKTSKDSDWSVSFYFWLDEKILQDEVFKPIVYHCRTESKQILTLKWKTIVYSVFCKGNKEKEERKQVFDKCMLAAYEGQRF